MRSRIAAALLLMSGTAFAQSGGVNENPHRVPDRPPNVRPPDAGKSDGRATATPAVIAVVTAAKARPGGVLLGPDAMRIRDLVNADGKLDETEIDLLDELAAPEIRAVTISPRTGSGPTEITGTVSGETLRVFEAVFEQQYRGWWDATDPVSGWRDLVRAAMRSNGAHSRVRKFLAARTQQAAQESTPANVYEPARRLVSVFTARNEQIAMPDRTLGRRLQYESFVDADIYVHGRLPDFIYSWLQQPPKAN